VRQIFREDKHQHYRAEKEVSKSLADRLKALNDSDFLDKQQTKSRVREHEEQSKRNYRLYMLQRQSAIKFHKESESNRLEELQERKELEMRNLARLEL
jgi:putative component of toxin-antitoxin plasmid stabilization module